MQVFDGTGRLVAAPVVAAQAHRLDVALPPAPGLYAVRISTSAGTTQRRLVVVR